MKLLLLCFVVVGGFHVNALSDTSEWFPIPVDADVAKKPLEEVLLYYGPEHEITFTFIYGSVESSSKFKVIFFNAHGGGTKFEECEAIAEMTSGNPVEIRRCTPWPWPPPVPVGETGKKTE